MKLDPIFSYCIWVSTSALIKFRVPKWPTPSIHKQLNQHLGEGYWSYIQIVNFLCIFRYNYIQSILHNQVLPKVLPIVNVFSYCYDGHLSTYFECYILGKANQTRWSFNVIAYDLIDLLHGVNEGSTKFVCLSSSLWQFESIQY